MVSKGYTSRILKMCSLVTKERFLFHYKIHLYLYFNSETSSHNKVTLWEVWGRKFKVGNLDYHVLVIYTLCTCLTTCLSNRNVWVGFAWTTQRPKSDLRRKRAEVGHSWNCPRFSGFVWSRCDKNVNCFWDGMIQQSRDIVNASDLGTPNSPFINVYEQVFVLSNGKPEIYHPLFGIPEFQPNLTWSSFSIRFGGCR